MKNTKKLIKMALVVLTLVCAISALALPVFAEETAAAPNSPQITFNSNFNANNTIRAIFNWLVGIIALVGIGVGGWHIASGLRNQDQKETTGGIVTAVASLAVGGLIILVLNMVLA